MNEIFLSFWQVAALLVLSGYIVLQGRIGWAMGIYTALPAWLTVIRFGNLNHLWVYLATLAGTMLVYRERHLEKSLLPKHDRWIIPWMTIWTLWMLFIIRLNQGDSSTNSGIVQSLLLYSLMPVPGFLLIATDKQALLDFARMFTLTTALGGLLALSRMVSNLGLQINYLVHDPFLSSYVTDGVHWYATQMGYRNYHWLAYGCSIALLLTLGLWFFSRRVVEQIIYIILVFFFLYVLLILGSRQSLWVSIALAFPYILWLRYRAKGMARLGLIIVIAAVWFGITMLMTTDQQILLRDNNSLLDSINIFADRGDHWNEGWQAFLESPLYGDLFRGSASLGHNYFISTLANQGIMGLFYLCGFLVFALRQMRGFRQWSSQDDLEVWRMTFLVVGLFSFLAGQASGSPVSNWPIFWAAAILWKFQAQGVSTTPGYREKIPLVFRKESLANRCHQKTLD